MMIYKINWDTSTLKIVILLLLGTAVLPCHSVSRQNFKTCKESSFCVRQREYWPSTPVHSVLTETIRHLKSELQFIVNNNNTNHSITVSITYLKGSTFRILIDEHEPLRPRYRVPIGDALVFEPEKLPFSMSKEPTRITARHGDDMAVIMLSPFKIDLFRYKTLIVSVNGRGLLNVEYQQEKPTFVPPPLVQETESEDKSQTIEVNSEQLDATAPPAVNEDGHVSMEPLNVPPEEPKPEEPQQVDWTENFHEHRDSRPYGPTSVGADIMFHGFEHAFGIPEHADTFLLKNTDTTDPYRLYNLDVFEYENYNPMALYGSVPVMWAHNENYTAGIFWHNPTETWIDIKSSKNTGSEGLLSNFPRFFSANEHNNFIDTRWMSESGVIDIFVILADSPAQALQSYAFLTGTTKLPPLFALGNHQCRWNYKDEADIQSVSENFDKHNLPLDTLWLDIEHANGKRYFTWDSSHFPTPANMVDKLSAVERKLVVVIDPHIRRDSTWDIFKDAQSKGLFVKRRDGGDFDGWCWPGSSSWPDFMRQEVEDWWSDIFLKYEPKRTETMFVWNDMNEPSVFNGPEITMHKDMIHGGGWEHRDVHNLFALHVHRATWNGILRRSSTERPFVLTRGFFAGSQRTSTVWTGDNTASWEQLQICTEMLLSLSTVGITFSGCDIGGFFGDPNQELLTRWYQSAAFQPFFRAHAHMDTKRREPYLLPNEYMAVVRSALYMRYALLPYWYTTFARSEYDAQPVMAPLWYHFPKDKATFPLGNEFMIGESLLVHPVVHQGVQYVQPYLPAGVWYLHNDWKVFYGGQHVSIPVDMSMIPVFYRGGWIVPKKERARRTSTQMLHDPYTFIVCIDPNVEVATGYLYIDDFHSIATHKTIFYKIEYISQQSKGSSPTGMGPGGYLQLVRLPPPGTNATDFKPPIEQTPEIERIVFVGFTDPVTRVVALEKDTGVRRHVEFTYSPPETISHKDGVRTGMLVVRKPGVHISDTWKLHIATGLEQAGDL